MKHSVDRILTTHVGSLPRVRGLADIIVAQEGGETIDPARYAAALETALDEVIAKQIECGIDIGNDGEMPRPTFFSYIADRMTGFGPGIGKAPNRPVPMDAKAFPIWFDQISKGGRRRLNVYQFDHAIGDIRYENTAAVDKECGDFLSRLAKHEKGFAEPFMTAVSPGFASTAMMNDHYDSHENYVYALARALKTEYEHIAASGLLLQIDSPDLGMERCGYFQDNTLSEFLDAMEMHIDALNMALENIPADQVRLHACWGNRDGPHVHDIPVNDVLPVMYRAKVGGISLPFANPRHQHEIEAFRDLPLPDNMVAVIGVIETTGNYVEHPITVAERLCRAAACVGDRERIVAGTDCGFGTVVGDTFTAEDVVWAKLKSLREGADLASKRLWG